jgi:hypothetical protein
MEKELKKEWFVYLSLFLSAFIIRIMNLGKVFTIDSIIWVNFYQQFAKAVFNFDFQYTYLHAHPGVISMWLSGLFLKIAGLVYPFEYTIPGNIFTTANALNPQFTPANMLAVSFYSHLPQVIVVCLSIVLIYYLVKRLLGNKTIALISGFLLAFSPSFIGYNTQYLTQDNYLACFITLSILCFLIFMKEEKNKFLILSGILFGLSILSKVTGVIFAGGIFLIFLIYGFSKSETKNKFSLKFFLHWILASLLTYFILWPAMWVSPFSVIQKTIGSVLALGGSFKHLILFLGQITQMSDIPGIIFYLVMLSLKLTPIEIGFFVISLFFIFTKKRFLKEMEYPFLILFFIFIYLTFLSLGTIKYHWYITPIIPLILILSSIGIYYTIEKLFNKKLYKIAFIVAVILFQLFSTISYFPYTSLYHSPLWGTYEHSSKLFTDFGGQGIEQTAVYLNQQPDIKTALVASWYFKILYMWVDNNGNSEDLNSFYKADYVVFPKDQLDHKYRTDVSDLYFNNFKPVYIVEFKGVPLAWVFKKPANADFVRNNQTGDTQVKLNK